MAYLLLDFAHPMYYCENFLIIYWVLARIIYLGDQDTYTRFGGRGRRVLWVEFLGFVVILPLQLHLSYLGSLGLDLDFLA